MKYISGYQALHLKSSLKTSGLISDFHYFGHSDRISIRWDELNLQESENSIFGDYGIEKNGTVAKLAMRQPFVLFKGLTFQKLCLPGAFRPGDHHNKMLRPGLCVVHASPQYL